MGEFVLSGLTYGEEWWFLLSGLKITSKSLS